MKTTFKDKITNICMIVLVFSGAVATLPAQGVVVPPIINTIAVVAATVAGAIVAYFTGKDSNGKTKVV